MNGGLQLIGMLIAMCGGLCTLISSFLPEWKRNDPKGEVIESVVRHQGIWIRCVSYSTGMWQCDDYDAFIIGLPTDLMVARWTSVIAILFGFVAYLMSIVGMECTKCVESNPTLKRRVALIASACWVLSGILMGVAASYFSHKVVDSYFQTQAFGDLVAAQSWVFGSALFIGWAAMALSMLGGLVMGCGSFSESSEISRYQRKSVRQVGRLGRSITQSFRRGREDVPLRKKREDADYV